MNFTFGRFSRMRHILHKQVCKARHVSQQVSEDQLDERLDVHLEVFAFQEDPKSTQNRLKLGSFFTERDSNYFVKRLQNEMDKTALIQALM